MIEPTTSRELDAFWEAARQLGEAMRQEGIARRQAARDERNRRRRVRYAATSKRPKAAPEPSFDLSEDDLHEPSCRCYIAPPCNFCMNQEEQ